MIRSDADIALAGYRLAAALNRGPVSADYLGNGMVRATHTATRRRVTVIAWNGPAVDGAVWLRNRPDGIETIGPLDDVEAVTGRIAEAINGPADP